jgi:hypothetical protein
LYSTTASLLYACLIIWNISLLYLPNFWQNLTFAYCWNCGILDFHHSQTSTLHNSDFLSEYTTLHTHTHTHTQLIIAEMREEQTRHHLMVPRIHCSA